MGNETTELFGIIMQQNDLAMPALSRLIKDERPVRIVEIGTGHGGLTIFLALTGIPIITYDRVDYRDRPNLFSDLEISFRNVDIWNVVDEIKDIIQLPGKTLLMCDGVTKPKEFVTFAPFLKDGDIIMAHDYQSENWTTVDIDDSVLEGLPEIKKFRMSEFGPAAWLCCKKMDEPGDAVSDFRRRPRAHIAICSKGDPDVRQVDSLWQSFNDRDMELSFSYNSGDDCVDRMMSAVTTEFLHSSADFLLFISHDMAWMPGTIGKIIEDAIQYDTVICGPYCGNNKNDRELEIAYLTSEPIAIGQEGKVTEVKYAGSGFVCIPKRVLEDVRSSLTPVLGKNSAEIYPFFMPMIFENAYLTLGYAFCQRVRDVGHKIMLDGSLVVGHIGKATFLPGSIEA